MLANRVLAVVGPIGVGQQLVDALLGISRQPVQVFADTLAQAAYLLWQDDAEFGYQAAHIAICRLTISTSSSFSAKGKDKMSEGVESP